MTRAKIRLAFFSAWEKKCKYFYLATNNFENTVFFDVPPEKIELCPFEIAIRVEEIYSH